MKISIFILIVSIVQVSASTFAQTVTINKNNVPMAEVLKQIRKQSGYKFIIDGNLLKNLQPVSVSVTNATIDQVMQKVLEGRRVNFVIKDKMVLISRTEPSFLDRMVSAFAVINVKGTITDNEGLPLPGATIKVKGLDKSTKTDNRGEFYLQNVEEGVILVISYLGFESKEIPAAKDLGVVKLTLADNKLQEVEINAGYYMVTERERTGSISRITAEQIEKQPINNILQGLQNQVPGLQVTQNTGVPGGGFSVQIRGKNSIANGNDPLYIIDGVTFPSIRLSSLRSNFVQSASGTSPLSMINPNDVQSIEILKDADATAIYGSKGANGVILITTKKGKDGMPTINIDITQGVNQVERQMELLNTDQYIMSRKEAFKNDKLEPSARDYDINGTWDQGKYTDWQKVLIGNTAGSTSSSLNVNGGNQKINYQLGGNFYREGTVFPGDFDFKRTSLHTSLGIGSPSTNGLSATFSANYSHTSSLLPNSDFTSLILLSPNAPDPYDEYGQLNWANNTVYQNPMSYLLQTNKSGADNFIGNLVLNYRIGKNLLLKSSFGYNIINRDEIFITPLASFSPAFNMTVNDRISYFSDNFNKNWIAEPQLNYNIKLGPGIFDSLVGLSYQQNNVQYRTIKASGYNSDGLMENMASAGLLSVSQTSYVQYRYTAAFSRLNYNIQDKYIINLTARRDGSSRFANDNRFANFGAVGIAWVFSKEALVQSRLPFISFGKLRLSYGVTGNDQITDYGYLQLWGTSNPYQGTSTITPTRIANPTYAWETNRKAEAAIQLGLFKGKVNIETTYYRNRSSNQLVGLPLPTSTGFNSIQANLPAEVENKGWEFDANFKILSGKTWSWLTSINLTIPRNKLLSYPDLATSTNAINYVVGQPLTILRTFNTYIDQQTGLYTREDYDGNGILNNNDRYQNKFTGQKYYGGLNNSFTYRQLSLDFFVAFCRQSGNNYMNGLQYSAGYFDFTGPFVNQPVAVLNRWQSPDNLGTTQKFSTTNSTYAQFLNARGIGGLSIEDASYLRLKNLSISYRLPNLWLSRLKIKQAIFSLQGQNIFTLSGYKGLDPESQSLATLPPLRTVSMKLNLTF